MMNIQDSEGEPSCKRQENGDGSTGSERPLKKARFAWQVKGKYHLKNDHIDETSASQCNDLDKPGTSSQKESSSVGNTEQNLEILGDYLLKQDFNTLDSMITDSLKPNTSVSTERVEFPRYVGSYEHRNRIPASTLNVRSSMVPMSYVATQSYNEDQCIARWQARQMAKGFVDNTINRVLDSWMIAPLPTDVDNNRFLALDVAEFINNLPGDNSIENEGILMAISAHGLQNNSSSSSHASHSDHQICSSSSSKDEHFSSRPSSPLQSEDECNSKTHEPNTSIADDSFSDLWSCSDQKDTNHTQSSFPLFPDPGSPPYINYNNDQLQNSIEFEDGNINDNDMLSSHFDFMDAAVTFAIQNKGLTSFGTDYG